MTNEARDFQWGEGSIQELLDGRFGFTFRKVTRTGRIGNSAHLIEKGITDTAEAAWAGCQGHNKRTFYKGQQNKAWK